VGRLSEELIARAKRYSHRVVDVAEVLAKAGRSRRIVEQMIGAGTSVGANVCEADEAISRPEFCKCLSTVVKELGESRFWVEFVGTREWVPAKRLGPLLDETLELKSIFGSMIARVRRADRVRQTADARLGRRSRTV
jgi:four helix bundle protein